jgi:hypothetical protein
MNNTHARARQNPNRALLSTNRREGQARRGGNLPVWQTHSGSLSRKHSGKRTRPPTLASAESQTVSCHLLAQSKRETLLYCGHRWRPQAGGGDRRLGGGRGGGEPLGGGCGGGEPLGGGRGGGEPLGGAGGGGEPLGGGCGGGEPLGGAGGGGDGGRRFLAAALEGGGGEPSGGGGGEPSGGSGLGGGDLNTPRGGGGGGRRSASTSPP